MEKITVGIESTTLLTRHFTGISFYTYKLIQYLRRNNYVELSLWNKLSRIKKDKLFPAELKSIRRFYFNKIPFGRKPLIAHSPDVHFLNFTGSKKIITIHDLAVLLKYSQIPRYTTRKTIEKFTDKISYALKHADFVITVSNTTKKDLINLFDFPEEKIRTIYLAPTIDKTIVPKKPAVNLPDDFLLFIGSISIRKNILNILRGYKLSGVEIPIAFAGGFSLGAEEIMQEVEKLKLSNVYFLGYVSEDEKKYLYDRCRAFIFPTYYEGFGIPVLEAMLHKKPVLIGEEGAAPEIAKNYAVKCSAYSPESIAEGIKKLLLPLPYSLEEASKYAKTFTWERTGRETVELYYSVL